MFFDECKVRGQMLRNFRQLQKTTTIEQHLNYRYDLLEGNFKLINSVDDFYFVFLFIHRFS